MRHLAAAGGMTNVNGVLQIEMRGQSRKVVGIVIHIMAVARLGRTAVTSSVMRDDAIPVVQEEQHLRVPVIGRQRPTMAEDEGLSAPPASIKAGGAVCNFIIKRSAATTRTSSRSIGCRRPTTDR